MKKAASLILILVVLVTFGFTQAEEDSPVMQLHQVDVGCANAYLLLSGETVILIECGINWYKGIGDTPDKLMNYIASTGIDHYDAHFITHWHNDHCLLMPELSELYGSDSSSVYGPSTGLPDFLSLPKGNYCQLKAGESLEIGPFHILCVAPETIRRDGHINEDSLNLLITFGSFRMLFTGDYLGDAVVDHFGEEVSGADVITFPHHGLEPYAITSRALQAINPRIVLLPGAPEGRVLQIFRRLRLDPEIYGNRHGNVVLVCDGTNAEVHTHAEPGEFAWEAVRPAGKDGRP